MVFAAMGKRQDILDGARRVFLLHGYHGTRIDDIVAEAKVSRRTLYQHFTTKEELFVALIESVCAQLVAPLLVPEGATGAPRVVLRRLALDYLTVIMAPSALQFYRTVIAESARFPELGRGFFEAGWVATVEALSRYLAFQTARGALAIADPRFAAEQFLVMVGYAPRTRRLFGADPVQSRAELARWAAKTVDLFMSGCEAAKAEQSRASPRRVHSP